MATATGVWNTITAGQCAKTRAIAVSACVVIAACAAAPAFGTTVMLECHVRGERNSAVAGNQSKLDPATVQVRIENESNLLSVAIDGPGGYGLTESSAVEEGKRVRKAIATADSFILQTTAQLPGGTSETAIFVNRKNGTIDVLRETSTPSTVSQISYSGACSSI